ncbi:MAG: alpha-mannosidase [Lachnospiraceae bacterium]|jgi:alpha-mannosidase|nr:alpha-mannosidase [Lachnospiraceae bacterium]MCI9097507.1 alpha-mannosidase [Lachnospiraceae bacterium]MCI9202413.1 alpha-mannosidase [Lachnospiraceae bacterium]
MRKIHLICNAHLDPVWLWRWEEGCCEALSTFRVAENFTDKFRGFTFNHNEAILYQWVKENEPDLYERIRKKVKEGSWHIMGGWYLQPDCNMPSGESIIRNIIEGRLFFREEFGKVPTTAINFDSFGHSLGLVQILNLAGYDSYVVCRPAKDNFDFPDQNYLWKGFNGSQVLVHRSDENYNSVHGHAAQELDDFLKRTKNEEISLFLWGVGDHGGGASAKDLEDLKKLIEEEKEYEIFHSDTESFFKELQESGKEFPVVERGLNPVAEGCYTSQIRVKQKHRLLENEIYSGEKMFSAAALLYGWKYPKEAVSEAVKDLLFSEFHDALPGSGTQLVEEDTLRLLDHGLEIMSREKMKAAIVLTAGEEKIKDGSSCAFLYNPHPYEITGQFSFEVGLPKQNWENVFYYPSAFCNGEPVKTQSEMESSHFCIDWRKKVVIEATLKPACMNRVDVSFHAVPARPVYESIAGKKEYVFENGQMSVVVNTATGLLDSYKVEGVEYIKPASFQLRACDDTYNSWGLSGCGSYGVRNLELLTPHEGSAFSGLGDKVIPSVRVIEDGEVRTVVETLFGWHDSKAYQRYIFPKKGTSIEIETGVYWNEKDTFLKLHIGTDMEEGDYLGQVMFGREKLKQGGQEVVAQKWNCLTNGQKALAVINCGNHGSCVRNGEIGITLLRSAGYSAADGNFECTLHEERHTVRMEQGERIFRFRVMAGEHQEILDSLDKEAQIFNEVPYGFALSPSGNGQKKGTFFTIDNPAVILSACKKAERKDGYVLRVYEAAGKENNARIAFSGLDTACEVRLNPYEIKTLYFDVEKCTIKETDLLD